jgi:hypothetical protein
MLIKDSFYIDTICTNSYILSPSLPSVCLSLFQIDVVLWNATYSKGKCYGDEKFFLWQPKWISKFV